VGLRENKFLRSKLQVQAKGKYGAANDNQPTADDQLTRLEDDIRRLRIEFDIFFNGAAKRPPYDTKGRVETLLKRLGDDRTLTFAQRYRYNSLAARYNAFRDHWRRTMQGREEGRDPASAARAHVKRESGVEIPPVSIVCADSTAVLTPISSAPRQHPIPNPQRPIRMMRSNWVKPPRLEMSVRFSHNRFELRAFGSLGVWEVGVGGWRLELGGGPKSGRPVRPPRQPEIRRSIGIPAARIAGTRTARCCCG